ncbi:SDR family NAD(P)-dependent oxidoreductase [Roseibium sp.]|uniref:SDR family NAD(P)-dependent oxidoreductase n=1 Tax=Roseibium sp. TaxID=1936156 RepID=UPI003A970F06
MTSLLVTGANRGIGFHIAASALAKGWSVFGSVRTAAQAQELETSLPGVTPMIFDVTDASAVKAAAEAFDGPLDILINNAGIIGPDRQSTLDMDFEGFARTLEINTLAPLAVSQAFLPALRRAQSGRILSISSQMSWMGYDKSDRIAYRASKAALNKVMQGLAADLKPAGISVCVIDPGWVATDMGGSAADNDPADVGAGVVALAAGLSLQGTGRFYKWTGEERPF